MLYFYAASVGAVAAGYALGSDLLSADPDVIRRFQGDPAVGHAGLAVFLDAPWNWPILEVPGFGPEGLHVGFSDSIPVLAVTAKLLSPLGISASQWWVGWLAATFVAQATCGLYAVRAWGASRLPTLLVTPLMMVLFPPWLVHVVHPSLFSNFVVLLAVGLVGSQRSMGPTRRQRVLFALVVLLALAIHPYLGAMAAVLLVAAAGDAVGRGQLAVAAGLRWVGGAAAVSVTWLIAGGYLTTAGSSEGGFGIYTVALVAPFRPTSSDLLDATPPGNLPTFAFLGTGLALFVLLAGVSVLTNARLAWTSMRRHQALIGGLALLCAWSVSPYVRVTGDDPYAIPDFLDRAFGSYRMAGVVASLAAIGVGTLCVASVVVRRVDATAVRGPLLVAGVAVCGGLAGLLAPSVVGSLTNQFRASGRFSWPLLYLLAIGALVCADRLSRRWKGSAPSVALAAFLLLILIVQIADQRTTFDRVDQILVAGGAERSAHIRNLESVVAAHDSVSLGPDFRCVYFPEGVFEFVDVMKSAALTGRDIDRIYSARQGPPDVCVVNQELDLSDPDQVVVFVEPVRLLLPENARFSPAEHCRVRRTLNICTTKWDELPPVVVDHFRPIDD